MSSLPNGLDHGPLAKGHASESFEEIRYETFAGRLALTEYSINSPRSRSVKDGGLEEEEPKKARLPKELLLENGEPDYPCWIVNATSRIYEACIKTQLTPAVSLSEKLKCNVLLKREDLQPVFSFKLRGAYHKMAHLDPADKAKGVVCCSAGNHAQGVAYSAQKLGIRATVVMPKGTPSIKVNNVRRLGAEVILHGLDFDEAKKECERLEKERGLVNIPPFDDEWVIAGQGTIGMELFGQVDMSKVEAIFCAVGGGGLIAGIGAFVKRMAPHVKIIGCEAKDANAMSQSLKAGYRVKLKDVGLFADGAAVRCVGKEPFRIAKNVMEKEVIELKTDEICAAIKDMYDDTRSGLEPAGALAIAGLKKYAMANPSDDPNRTLIAITSGANMNYDRLRFVAERAFMGEGTEALLAVTIPERPGSFSKLVDAIAPRAITEFSYRFANKDKAHVLIGVAVDLKNSTHEEEVRKILDDIAKCTDTNGIDVSDDELAKSHIRYLGGGRPNIDDERVFLFSFPERPGVLAQFLTELRPQFNISLFQYRHIGGDLAKILMGIQCPPADSEELYEFLNSRGYPYQECTDAAVCKIFLNAPKEFPSSR